MRRTTGLLSGLLLLLAACGDDSEGGQTAIEGNAGPITSAPDHLDDTVVPKTAPESALEEETIEVGAEIHYAGFRGEIEEGRVVLNGEADEMEGEPGSDLDLVEPVVEVDAVVENLRDDDARFPADEIELQWTGGSSASGFVESDVVTTGAEHGITFRFPVDESFSFDEAMLYAGSPAEIQAVVPLSDPGATEPAAPIVLQPPTESGRDGDLEAEITGLVLHASNPWGVVVGQRPLDQPILEVTMDLTRHDESSYGTNFFTNLMRLELPDGTQIAPPSGSDGGHIDGPLEAGSTLTDAVVTFELDDMPFDPDELGGEEFALLASPGSGTLDGDLEARVPFELQVES